MDINSMIYEIFDNYSSFKLYRMYIRLKKDIKHALSSIQLSNASLVSDLTAIYESELFKADETDDICFEYNLPLKGASKIHELLSESYYYNHLDEIVFLQGIYELDSRLLNTKIKSMYAEILPTITAIQNILLKTATAKHLDDVLKRYQLLANDINNLKEYYKELAY